MQRYAILDAGGFVWLASDNFDLLTLALEWLEGIHDNEDFYIGQLEVH